MIEFHCPPSFVGGDQPSELTSGIFYGISYRDSLSHGIFYQDLLSGLAIAVIVHSLEGSSIRIYYRDSLSQSLSIPLRDLLSGFTIGIRYRSHCPFP